MPFRILKVFLSTEVGFYRQNNALSTGTCRSDTSLASKGSCDLNYTIPSSSPNTGAFELVAEGDNATNSPATLETSIATLGRF